MPSRDSSIGIFRHPTARPAKLVTVHEGPPTLVGPANFRLALVAARVGDRTAVHGLTSTGIYKDSDEEQTENDDESLTHNDYRSRTIQENLHKPNAA